MADKKYIQWLTNQPHKPQDEITPWQRLTSRYLPPAGVTTWGEWYKAENVNWTGEKETTTPTDSTRDLTPKITMTKVRIENNKNELYNLEPGSKEYKDTQALIKKDEAELADLQARYDNAKATEDAPKVKAKNQKTKEDYNNKVKTWEQQVAEAEKNVKRAQDAGGDVQGAKEELDRIKGNKPQEPSYQPVPTPTPTGSTTGKDGQLPPNMKAPETKGGSTVKDSDGDGIPDTIDKNPTKPDKKPTPTSTSSSTTTVSTSAGTYTPAQRAADDAKTIWINHLREAFKSIDDPKAKAQIDAIFKQASAKGSGWTEQTFLDALNNVQWWNNQLPALRNWFLLTHDSSKAGQLAELRNSKTQKVQDMMAQLGIAAQNVDPVTGKIIDTAPVISGLVDKALANNWTDAQLQHYMATSSDVHFTGGGLIQSNVDKLKDTAHLYGLNIDGTMLKNMQTDLLDSTSGRDYSWWNNQLQNMAADTYKPFSAAIKGGSNLYNATYNYRTQMANLLEVAPENITWKDLMGGVIDPKTGNARTESDFVAQVKQNPLWQRTANARETYMGMANDLMREFGITG